MKHLLIASILALPLLATAAPTPQYIKTSAIEIKLSDETLPAEMLKKIESHKLITIGEVHGNEQSPEFVSQVAKALAKKGKVVLALELRTTGQAGVNEFLKTGDEEALRNLPIFKDQYKDGRTSLAMVKLLKSIREIKNISVFLFDPGVSNTLERDYGMAENIIRAANQNKGSKIVMLAGNLHSALKKGNAFDPEFESAAFLLTDMDDSPFQAADVFAINIRYPKGSSSWMCFNATAADCGVKTFGAEDVYSTAIKSSQYFLVEPQLSSDGYHASLFIGQATASEPF